jgi:SAM-dependent methyltransferase
MTAAFKSKASGWQRIADHLLFPVNMWLGEEQSTRLGLTPIDHERIRIALRYCKGKLLDVGCGDNLLVRTYGDGIGVDIHSYPEIGVRCTSDCLPFKSNVFDSLALLACLNHITRRSETLDECHRVLKDDGRLLVTMISPWVGYFSHKIRKRHDPDQIERGMGPEEDWGLSRVVLEALLAGSGFRITLRRRFMWGLNRFYLAEKAD